jgi:hypothetical protein
MKMVFSLCGSLLLVLASAGSAQVDRQTAPIKTTLCDLAEHADRYAGKLVAVHATAMGRDFLIDDHSYDQPCSAWTWVIVVYPYQIKPAPGFDLERDDALHGFFEELHKGMNVEATYEGRFDVAYIVRDHQKIFVGSEKGYGRRHRYGGRIVLRRISDVVARPIYHK